MLQIFSINRTNSAVPKIRLERMKSMIELDIVTAFTAVGVIYSGVIFGIYRMIKPKPKTLINVKQVTE